jgi:hypothetical protein
MFRGKKSIFIGWVMSVPTLLGWGEVDFFLLLNNVSFKMRYYQLLLGTAGT